MQAFHSCSLKVPVKIVKSDTTPGEQWMSIKREWRAIHSSPLPRPTRPIFLKSGQPPAQNVGQRLDAQFNEHERFGNQISSTTQARSGATLEVGQARHKDDRCRFVRR